MSTFKFKIGEKEFEIENLDESMNSQLLKLHESHFSGHGFDYSKFGREALDFFDKIDGNYISHNGFFNSFTIIWRHLLTKGLFLNAEHLWILALSFAYQWEDKNQKRIHKGTPYYFWGVTCILNGDLEKGFLLMHQALEEDKITFQIDNPNTPAYSFVVLDYEKQDQFFRSKVAEIATFVSEKLNKYCSSRGGKLNLLDFKSKFLEESNLQEVVFYFVFESFCIKKLLEELDQRLMQNVFSSLLQSKTIFIFCLILDNVLKYKNPAQWRFADQLKYLSSNSSLNFDGQKIGELNREFNNNFSNVLQDLLRSQYSFSDGSKLQPIEEDLAISYGFRNFGAHRIEDQPIIYKNFDEISERILNALFFSIEKLY